MERFFLVCDGNSYMRWWSESDGEIEWAVKNINNTKYPLCYCCINYNKDVVKNQKTHVELEKMRISLLRKLKLEKIHGKPL